MKLIAYVKLIYCASGVHVVVTTNEMLLCKLEVHARYYWDITSAEHAYLNITSALQSANVQFGVLHYN